MAMKFGPKILGLGVGIFWTVFGSLGLWLRLVLIPRLMSSGFVVCLVFAAVFGQNSGNEKWTEPRQVPGGVEAR